MKSGRILLVEDNDITRKMVRFSLENQGFTVLEARDGATALQLAAEGDVHLVLQDLMLPDVDGFELVGKLRQIPGLADAPILAFSGFLSKLEEARISAVGFTDVINKPIEPSRLLHIVRAHLPFAAPLDRRVGVGKRVLIADDDPVQNKLACFRFERLGFEAVRAHDGEEALMLCRELQPDVIVSDIMMPRLDGFGLTVAVREDPQLAHVPIVLMTNSYVDDADRDLARRAGATDCVLRTPGLHEVVTAVLGSLATTQASSAGDFDPVALERERAARVMKQLERQVALNAGMAQRCATLSAELSVLSGISQALATEQDISVVLGETLAACFDAGGISVGALYVFHTREVHAFGGESEWQPGELDGFFGAMDLLRAIAAERKTVVLPSLRWDGPPSDALLRRSGVKSVLIAPLVRGDHVDGALVMLSRSADLDLDDRVAFAQGVANQISVALALARSFEDKAASERRAREQATLLRCVLEAIADGVVVADRNGRFRVWNPAASVTLKMDPPDGPPERWSEQLGLLHPEGASPLGADQFPLLRALRGESVETELLQRRPGAESAWLSVNARPLRSEDGGAVAVFRDISMEKNAQSQLVLSDRMASVGALAASVAHEINNPLASVIANLELATLELESSSTRTAADELRDAREGAERVRTIVRDLKMFSREDGEWQGPVDVRRALASSLRMASNEIRHRARLVTDWSDVPSVIANEARLGQVFLNLIVNAAQAIPEGHAHDNRIRVGARTDASGNVVVEVADTGVGMSPETMRQLFTPFFTTKPAGDGTGLGLSICRRLVQGMGGRIAVESVLGEGTTFRVVLPPARVSGRITRSIAPAVDAVPARRGRVLIVDDEEAVATTMGRALAASHDVALAHDGAEALARIMAGEVYDVILCDLMMPVLTGMELHAQLAMKSPEHATRIVFVTGGAFTAEARTFLEHSENLQLEKPFDVKTLRRVVDEEVRRATR
ncbi:MAG TPA: response regulator [Nannocystaceae bacterium]|nr:response regulator [Nannocystaceae bacterium]